MTREDIIRMALEVGLEQDGDNFFSPKSDPQVDVHITDLGAFAALVASAEREKYEWDIHSCGPNCNRYACVATRKAVLAEREACAKWLEDVVDAPNWADVIRARGQA